MIKKVPLLPNVITAFGLSCGLFVIFKVATTPSFEMTPAFIKGMIEILLLAALADLLDGAIARVMKMESSFGGLFDSLADGVSFGVAPAVIVLKTFTVASPSPASFFLLSSAMIFSLCGILRLVRFSVTAQERQNDVIALKHFTGLPIPAAALAAIATNLWFRSFDFAWFSGPREWLEMATQTTAMIFLGYLMVSRLQFFSLKTLEFRVASFHHVFFIVVGAVIVFYGLMYHFSHVFMFTTWGYIVLSLLFLFYRKARQRYKGSS